MARLKENDHTKRMVYDSKETFEWLKKNRYPITEVFRQGVKALREGKWEYENK